MTRLNRLICATLVSASAMIGTAQAESFTRGDLTVDDPWTRPTPPGVTMGVGYMSIHNGGSTDVTLTGAASAKSDKVTLHESVTNNGVVSMQFQEDGIRIPAGETVMLKPHGYHLMLEGLDRGIQRNAAVPVTLSFDGAEAMNIELYAKPMDEATSEHSMN